MIFQKRRRIRKALAIPKQEILDYEQSDLIRFHGSCLYSGLVAVR